MNPIQIVLAEYDHLIRDGLKCIIHQSPEMQVAFEATLREDLDRCPVQPDVVCLSKHLPPAGGVAAIPEIKSRWPSAKLLLICEEGHLSICRSALLAGVDGIVLTTCSGRGFLTAIQTVYQGEQSIPDRLREALEMPAKIIRRADRTPLQSLSHRERQVLICLSRGMSYKFIAEKLTLGVKSIETYRARLFRKLSFESKADLMRFAMDNGLMNATADI